MGVYLCPVHGRSGIAHVCTHLRQDVLAGRAVRPFFTYCFGRVGSLPTRFCPECLQARSLPLADTVVPDEQWASSEREAARYEAEAVCHKCFQQLSGSVPAA